MADTLTPAERSVRMSKIRSKDTKPELLVRKLLHRLGYRYRLHQKDLPGRPDIAFRRRKKAILVHGCFWHNHVGCSIAHIPKSRSDYWQAKLDKNVARDARNLIELESAGWSALVIWECEVRDPQALTRQLVSFLGPTDLGCLAESDKVWS
jgi:DNA mismatch endonuclease (patch repair protein)